MVEAVDALVALLTREQLVAMCLPVDSELWRHWQNTELYVEHHGLRLDETSAPIQDAVMAVLRASLSEPDAFRRLQKLARDQNRKLVDVAMMIITAEKALQPAAKL